MTVETLYLLGEIAAELAGRGLAVHLFNQRDLAGILAMIRTLGALVGVPGKAEALAASCEARLAAIWAETAGRAPRPRAYFEEWDDPLIAGIGWVCELIEVAGGPDAFADLRRVQAARERIVTPEAVIAARPDLSLASWCGRKVVASRIAAVTLAPPLVTVTGRFSAS